MHITLKNLTNGVHLIFIRIALVVTLVSCHRYEDPEPISFDLPEELAVEATEVWIRSYNFASSLQIKFEYNGTDYQLGCIPVLRFDDGANSFCLVDKQQVITTPTDQFSSTIWSQEDETLEGKYNWGNAFNDFDSFTMVFESIEPVNPGYKAGRDDMLGIRKLSVSINPEKATMIYSQSESGGFDSEAYSRIHRDNPDAMISNVHIVLANVAENYTDTSIKNLQE